MRTGEHKGPETVSGAEPPPLRDLRDEGSLSPGVSSLENSEPKRNLIESLPLIWGHLSSAYLALVTEPSSLVRLDGDHVGAQTLATGPAVDLDSDAHSSWGPG